MNPKLPLLALLLAAAPTTSVPATQPLAKTDTPENALRSFFHPMFLHDAKLGAAVTIPREGADILYQNPATPFTPAESAEMLKWADTVPITRPALRDTFTLPDHDHHIISFDENYITSHSQPLLVKDAPTFFMAYRNPDGRWLIDPGSLIAGRRAVQKFLKEHHAASQPTFQPTSQP